MVASHLGPFYESKFSSGYGCCFIFAIKLKTPLAFAEMGIRNLNFFVAPVKSLVKKPVDSDPHVRTVN